MTHISEPDWRLLTKLKPLALDRLCAEILTQLQRVAADTAQNHHERYLKVFAIIDEQDKRIAHIFNGLSRSNALSRLAQMKDEKLLTEAEVAMFSNEAQGRAK